MEYTLFLCGLCTTGESKTQSSGQSLGLTCDLRSLFSMLQTVWALQEKWCRVLDTVLENRTVVVSSIFHHAFVWQQVSNLAFEFQFHL